MLAELIAPPKAQGEIISHFVLNKFVGLVSCILISFFNLLIKSGFILDAVTTAPALLNNFANLPPTLPTPLIAT